jgi:hypothetical protein
VSGWTGPIYAALKGMNEIALASSVKNSVKYRPQFAARLQICKVFISALHSLMSVNRVLGSSRHLEIVRYYWPRDLK